MYGLIHSLIYILGTKTFTIDNDLSKLAMPVAESNCTTFFDPANATWVLEKVLEELELIKVMKQGNSTPEGIKVIN